MQPLVSRRRIGLLAGLGLLAALLLAACGPAPAGRIALGTVESDFGTIPNTAPVSRTFEVRNEGDGPLEITGLSTSCSCTTAIAGRERLNPGEATELEVTFDPRTHNGATGEFLRKVFVRSTDPQTPEVVLTFTVTVVEAQEGKRL